MKKCFDQKASQCVKGLAIIMMVMYHALGYSPRAGEVSYLFLDNTTCQGFFSKMGLCIALFVFVSAYGITQKCKACDEEKQNYGQVVKNRVLSIMTGTFAVYTSVLLLFFWKFDLFAVYETTSAKNLGFFMLMDALGLAQFTNSNWLNGGWWYLALALELIFIVLLLHMLYQKIGPLLVLFAVMVAMSGYLPEEALNMYFPTMALGVWAAEENGIDLVITKLCGKREKKSAFLGLICLLAFGSALFLILFTYPYSNGTYSKGSPIVLACIAFLLVLGVSAFVKDIPGIKQVLAYLGKHSMNIYLFHTFLFDLVFPDTFYALKNGELILLSVLGISLLYSVLLELLKKGLGKAYSSAVGKS